MCLWQVSLADSSEGPIGHLVVFLCGALHCCVDVSWNCDYFGTIHMKMKEIVSKRGTYPQQPLLDVPLLVFLCFKVVKAMMAIPTYSSAPVMYFVFCSGAGFGGWGQ